MIQAIVKKGKVIAEQVPRPTVSKGHILIKVAYSCISVGTEMSNVNETKKPLIKRALEQPEQVKTVIEFAKDNGIKKTIQRVKGTVEGGKPTGYSISGIIIELGAEVRDLEKGDHVAAAGAGLANHAEYVSVPINLVMKVPKNLDLKYASTVTLGGIAMQGVRRADLKLGEICVVVGAGVLGLLAQQMLQVSGIRTIVTDLDPHRLKLANQLGAEHALHPNDADLIKYVQNVTDGYGTDAVLFTAATSSNEPLSQSFKMCKKKGKVVLVGVSGMQIKRGDIYAKELDFLISTSYGPGRYDRTYEEKGLDYPYGYVRWTENRNMTEYLRLLSKGSINLEPLIGAIYPINEVEKAYESLNNNNSETPKPIITLLEYPKLNDDPENKIFTSPPVNQNLSKKKDAINVGLVGVGGFATGMHLPNLESLKKKFKLKAVLNRSGHKAVVAANQYNAEYTTSEYDEMLNDPSIDLIMICTRHDSHADLTLKALHAGKHVFVEKPLAINEEQLNQIQNLYTNKTMQPPLLMVGFNRRFSKYAREIKRHTSQRINPLFIHYRMNAGHIPLDHWIHESGGRIIGEACHIIDLMCYFTNSNIVSISSEKLSPTTSHYTSDDNRAIILKFHDGSVATIHYFATGNKEIPKEYMEIHFDGKSIVMDDYKSLKGYGLKIKNIKSNTSQKGQYQELEFLYDSLTKNSEWPISLSDMIQTTRATFLIRNQM